MSNEENSNGIEGFKLVDEKVALKVPRFPSYERCPAHLGRETSWEEAEAVTELIKARFPQRIVVERFALTRCPHKECPYRIVGLDPKDSNATRTYCTYLDIVVKADEAKHKGGKLF